MPPSCPFPHRLSRQMLMKTSIVVNMQQICTAIAITVNAGSDIGGSEFLCTTLHRPATQRMLMAHHHGTTTRIYGTGPFVFPLWAIWLVRSLQLDSLIIPQPTGCGERSTIRTSLWSATLALMILPTFLYPCASKCVCLGFFICTPKNPMKCRWKMSSEAAGAGLTFASIWTVITLASGEGSVLFDPAPADRC